MEIFFNKVYLFEYMEAQIFPKRLPRQIRNRKDIEL